MSAGERWKEFLERELGATVEVVFGRARRTPVQVTRSPGFAGLGKTSIRLRLHGMFAEAPPEVLDAVARWIKPGRSRATDQLLDRWIATELERLPPEAARRVVLRPEGECHDLVALQHDLCATEFRQSFAPDSKPLPALTWGRRGKSRTRWSLRLGSFYPEEHLVRIHPVLDQPAVPAWFVRYVVFHEHLHAVFPPSRDDTGRMLHHGPDFNRREALYTDYAHAVIWQELNLPRLIRSARSGKRLKATKNVPGQARETQPESKPGFRQRELFG